MLILSQKTLGQLLNIDKTPQEKNNVYPIDTLTLSCTKFNHRDKHFLSLEMSMELIREADMKLTDEIVDYYSKKIMMWKLLGKPLTKFREDLNTYIHSDRKNVPEEFMGLVYKLPYFYALDKEYDQLKLQFNKVNSNTHILSGTFELEFVKTITNPIKAKKYIKDKEYWFSCNQEPYVLKLASTNNLLSVWDSILEKNHKVLVSGSMFLKNYDDFPHWELAKWKLESL